MEPSLERRLFRTGDQQHLADTSLPASRAKAATRRVEGLRRAAAQRSDLDLLRDLQGIVDLDSEVPDSRFQLGMT